MGFLKRGRVELIVDQKIADKIRPDSMKKFGKIVEQCLADEGVDRPSMEDVLRDRNYALQLQDGLQFENAGCTGSDDNSMNSIVKLIPSQSSRVLESNM
ncbi:hypothetical protein EJB05_34293, partial [Eragrostis curvula]